MQNSSYQYRNTALGPFEKLLGTQGRAMETTKVKDEMPSRELGSETEVTAQGAAHTY